MWEIKTWKELGKVLWGKRWEKETVLEIKSAKKWESMCLIVLVRKLAKM